MELLMQRIKLLSGTANLPLAQLIAEELNTTLCKTVVGQFSDGEIQIEIQDSVRKDKAFIIQPTCAPTNDTLMELLLMADALYRSSTKKITAIIPYYGYARADRRLENSRTPISAKVVAGLLQSVNIDHIVTVDLHAIQIQGFFDIPVDNLSAGKLFVSDIRWNYPNNTMVVSPDIGGVGRARALAKHLGVELAVIDKRRPKAGVSEVMNIIGDVEDKVCIITDDMIDSGGTLCNAAQALMDNGAAKVVAYCTHPILSGSAYDRINNSVLTEVVVTDTIPLTKHSPKIRQISVAPMLAETIRRLSSGDSISELSR
jgi:ribose-phosphate pyrophosphokinase